MATFEYTVRFGGGNYAKSGSAIYLRRPGGDEVQLKHSLEDFCRLRRKFPDVALDLALLSLLAYGCDRASSRAEEEDQWTRSIVLEVPVSDVGWWSGSRENVERLLSFLTGDEWVITFRNRTEELFGPDFLRVAREFRHRTRVDGSAVSLFSGGLDSLIGVIDWLETHRDESITLSGAYDASAEAARDDQERLLVHLRSAYPERSHYLSTRMGIVGRGADNNYRSRSLCFIAFGMLAAQFIGDGTEVIVPENGGIGLNYPLTPARSGSLSTRTVHPHFIATLQGLASSLGLNCPVSNPFRIQTKGEMIARCQNQDLLRQIYPEAISCGKRKRYKVHVPGAKADHCGYCVPCIIRRAALSQNGWPEGDYGVWVEDKDRWGLLNLADGNSDIEAIKDFVLRGDSDREIWERIVANGGVPSGEKKEYIDLVKHQRRELETWLRGKGMIP